MLSFLILLSRKQIVCVQEVCSLIFVAWVFKLQNNLCNLGQLLSINNRHLAAVLPFNWPNISNGETFFNKFFSSVQNFGKNRQSSVLQSASNVGCPGAVCILFCVFNQILLLASHWSPRLTWPECWALIGWVRPGPNLYCPAATKLSKKSELMWKYKGNMSYNIRI